MNEQTNGTAGGQACVCVRGEELAAVEGGVWGDGCTEPTLPKPWTLPPPQPLPIIMQDIHLA